MFSLIVSTSSQSFGNISSTPVSFRIYGAASSLIVNIPSVTESELEQKSEWKIPHKIGEELTGGYVE